MQVRRALGMMNCSSGEGFVLVYEAASGQIRLSESNGPFTGTMSYFLVVMKRVKHRHRCYTVSIVNGTVLLW